MLHFMVWNDILISMDMQTLIRVWYWYLNCTLILIPVTPNIILCDSLPWGPGVWLQAFVCACDVQLDRPGKMCAKPGHMVMASLVPLKVELDLHLQKYSLNHVNLNALQT